MPEPLLPRIARGDSAAVDECLDRYGSLVWSLSLRFAPTDAEDACQEIFLELWRSAGRFREEVGTEVAFVSTLARRRLIDRRRRVDRRPRFVPLEPGGASDVRRTPLAELIAAEDCERIRGCLGALKDRDREAVELSVYDGLSQSQIALRLDAPIGTVKTVIRRALIRLRDCVGSLSRAVLSGGAP